MCDVISFDEISVEDVLSDIYKQYGKDDEHKGSHDDPDSCNTYEMLARRRALRSLPTSDRSVISDAIDVIRRKANIGSDAALAVIMRLGIYLDACEKRMQ